MIFDGFTFFNELELLELRLEIMWEYVDRFILVEAKRTFTNEKKALYYEENKEKFRRFWDKIEYVVIDEFPDECKTAWDREYYQRNAIYRGLKNTNAQDILLVSDLDEIISPYGIKRVQQILRRNPNKILNLELLNCWYFLNYVDQKAFFLSAPRACTVEEAKRCHKECKGTYMLDNSGRMLPQTIRAWNECETVPCAGWHFSYMGGIKRIKKKIQAFSHQEYNSDEWLDDIRIKKMIESGKDLFDRKISDFASIPVGYFMPKPVKKNPEKYKEWLCEFKPISCGKYFRLRIKYLCETTWIRRIFHKLKNR